MTDVARSHVSGEDGSMNGCTCAASPVVASETQQHKRKAVSLPGWCPWFHCSYHFLLYFFQHITVTVIIILLTRLFFDYFVPFLFLPWPGLFSMNSWFCEVFYFFPVCTLFFFSPHELQLVGFSAVSLFCTHAGFVTMLAWTRGGSHNPHMIYSRGRNNCFHVLMLCIYIFFPHFGG